MLTDTQRAVVVKEAASWNGTPYRGWTCLKGMGVDCGQLIYGVFRACGFLPLIDDLPKDYSLQVAQHQTSTEYMKVIDTYFRDVPEADVKPGDIACYTLGLSMAHAAIIVSWPSYIIQAELRHGVSGSHGINNPALRQHRYLRGTVRAFRTLRDEYCQGGK
jgi:cell wall-associated NlpC family hydrolase